MEKVPVSTIVPFGLRLQPDLKSRLEDAAKANNRSLNAEIADRLAASFEAREDARAAVAPILEKLDALTRLVKGGQQLDIFADAPRDEPHAEPETKPPKKRHLKLD